MSHSPSERVTVTIVTFRSRPVSMDAAEAALADQTVGFELLTHHNTQENNLGFAGGHNLLLARAFDAGAELAIVHNPDVALRHDALAMLLAESRRRPLSLLGPVLERAELPGLTPTGLVDTLGITWTRDGRHLDAGHAMRLPSPAAGGPWRAQGVSAACLAIPVAAYRRIVSASGEFFDADFIAYREDAELAIRASVLGIESWMVPSAKGLHVRHQRGTSRGADALVDMLGVRNRFLIAAKWGRRRPGILPAILFRDFVVIVAVLLIERSSLTGLAQAWRLRATMREKRRRVLAWSRDHPIPEP